MFDLCIVGAGLIGTAAARHAVQVSGRTICLIGPSEPKTDQKVTVVGRVIKKSKELLQYENKSGNTMRYFNIIIGNKEEATHLKCYQKHKFSMVREGLTYRFSNVIQKTDSLWVIQTSSIVAPVQCSVDPVPILPENEPASGRKRTISEAIGSPQKSTVCAKIAKVSPVSLKCEGILPVRCLGLVDETSTTKVALFKDLAEQEFVEGSVVELSGLYKKTYNGKEQLVASAATQCQERSSKTDRDIYGAYYDEGRITRSCDPDPVWAKLALESIKRYREIEKESGISFYNEVGNLMVGSGADSKYITSIKGAAQACNVKTKLLDSGSLHEQCPFLIFPEDAQAVLETQNAGFINPRKLVEAQKKLASRQGCTIIDDVVRKVDRIVQSNGAYIMRVETETGREYFAKSVLLTTGAFTRFRNLLPSDLQVEHAISALTVALLEVELEVNNDQSLSNMPCILYKGRGFEDWCIPDLYKTHDDIYFYMLPPIKYPDGRYYIKLGFINPNGRKLESRAEMKRWYDEGDIAFKESVAKFTESLFKGIKFVSWKGDSCAIMDTPTVRPYVDHIHDQLGVAIGGNGYAAKSSDEIGRLGASMMLTGWNSEIPKEVFKIKFCTHAKL